MEQSNALLRNGSAHHLNDLVMHEDDNPGNQGTRMHLGALKTHAHGMAILRCDKAILPVGQISTHMRL